MHNQMVESIEDNRYSFDEARKSENFDKNRYIDVLPCRFFSLLPKSFEAFLNYSQVETEYKFIKNKPCHNQIKNETNLRRSQSHQTDWRSGEQSPHGLHQRLASPNRFCWQILHSCTGKLSFLICRRVHSFRDLWKRLRLISGKWCGSTEYLPSSCSIASSKEEWSSKFWYARPYRSYPFEDIELKMGYSEISQLTK